MISFSSSGYEAEYLERLSNLISQASRKIDPNETAKLLLDKYGGIENIVAVEMDELSNLVGEQVAFYLKLVGRLTSRRYTDIFNFKVKHSQAELGEYVRSRLLGESVEVILAFPVDGQGRVLECREVSRGTVNSSSVLARKLAEVAVMTGVNRLMIAHNHPRGTAKPSDDDIAMTDGIADSLLCAGIRLENHFVVSVTECEIIVPKCIID